MEKKIEVKEEDPVLNDIASQNEREFLQKVNTVKTSIDDVRLDIDCNIPPKTEIKSETPFIKQNQIKTETVTCSTVWEIHGTNDVEQNKETFLPEDPVIMDKKYSSDQEIHNKIEIKEEPWWLETETSSVCDNSKEAFAEPDQEDEYMLSSQLPRIISQGASEEREMSTSLIHSEPRVHCQMEQIPSQLKTAKFASYYECGKSEEPFKLNFQPRPYKCDKCEKSFKKKSHLVQHVLLHSDKRKYKCKICKKSFKQKSGLNFHIRTHSDTRPYKCDKCEKYFKHKSGLIKHFMLHSDTRPYNCYKCEKSFKQKSLLDQHILLHSDTRSFKCEKCEKSFKQRPCLIRHLVSHSDTRPYKCEKCEKSFKLKANLDQHILLHSETRPYKCNKCEKSFKQKVGLRQHVKLH